MLPRIFFASLALVTSQVAYASGFSVVGTVERVVDGDTVELLTSDSRTLKVRLLGIDAPESRQPFGDKSTQNLFESVSGAEITARCIGLDRYGRSICKLISHSVDINLLQIQRGMAWHYRQYMSSQSPQDRSRYAEAEELAKGSRTGLWGGDEVIPPWEYRRHKNALTSNSPIDLLKFVKMSRSRLCHIPGSKYYKKTKNFRSFPTLEKCIAAGGRTTD